MTWLDWITLFPIICVIPAAILLIVSAFIPDRRGEDLREDRDRDGMLVGWYSARARRRNWCALVGAACLVLFALGVAVWALLEWVGR